MREKGEVEIMLPFVDYVVNGDFREIVEHALVESGPLHTHARAYSTSMLHTRTHILYIFAIVQQQQQHIPITHKRSPHTHTCIHTYIRCYFRQHILPPPRARYITIYDSAFVLYIGLRENIL